MVGRGVVIFLTAELDGVERSFAERDVDSAKLCVKLLKLCG